MAASPPFTDSAAEIPTASGCAIEAKLEVIYEAFYNKHEKAMGKD